MGREIRKVPPNHEHPKDSLGKYIPLRDGFEEDLKEFEQRINNYGLREAVAYFAGSPNPEDYMLVDYNEKDGCHYEMPQNERTWIQVYETVSEGTPCSPPFETKEELVNYLMTEGGLRRKEYPDLFPLLTREQAERFVESGSALTMIMDEKGPRLGIQE